MIINYDEMVETQDGLIPLCCLGSIESREMCEDGSQCVTTKYLYQGVTVRQDFYYILPEDVFKLPSISL